MTKKEMLQTYHDRFHEVLESKSDSDIKDARYAAIMHDMEKAFGIWMYSPERNCPEVMKLYFHISTTRSFDEAPA